MRIHKIYDLYGAEAKFTGLILYIGRWGFIAQWKGHRYFGRTR